MFSQILVPFLAVSALLVLLLSALVVVKKIARTAGERSSRRRRERYRIALVSGSSQELTSMAAEARRGVATQEDLAEVMSREYATLSPERWRAIGEAAHAGGLVASINRGLESRWPMRRGRAALLTARLRLPGGVVALEPLLRDPDVDVRYAALGGLTLLATHDAARVLVRALPAGRLSADRIVERVGAGWGVPALLDALEDPSFAAVRGHLAEALGLARDARGREPLEELLQKGSDDERTRACRALGRFGGGDAEASHDLLMALADPFWPVRAQAAKSLGEIGDSGVAPFIERGLVDPAWWVRANCATALRGLGEPGLEALRRALHHPDRFASDRAAEALSLEAARPGSHLAVAELAGG